MIWRSFWVWRRSGEGDLIGDLQRLHPAFGGRCHALQLREQASSLPSICLACSLPAFSVVSTLELVSSDHC